MPERADYDVVVLGAGPAGMGAAATAAEAGLKTALLDLLAAPGGQAYRLPVDGIARAADDPDRRAGDALRARVAASGAHLLVDRRAWLITDRFVVDAVGGGGSMRLRAPHLVVATGTSERLYPFPGWTLPGVIGLAAATVLLKADAVVPGRRLAVAGAGPLLPLVAAKALAAGAQLEAIIDLTGVGDWLGVLPRASSRPDLIVRGARWLGSIAGRRVPWHRRTTVASAEAHGDGLRLGLVAIDREGRPLTRAVERWIEVDVLAIGHGLVPGTDVTRLLRCEHRFDTDEGVWLPLLDAEFRTTDPDVFVVGDAAGVRGAAAAPLTGAIAATAIARDAGGIDAATAAARIGALQSRWRRVARFGAAMTSLAKARPGLLALADDQTLLCRCEDVARREVAAAIAAGAAEVNQLKAWTRAGMGPCQGRVCGEAVAELMAAEVGGREAAGLWTGRAPLRPVPLDTLVGDYGYDAIGIPEAAPL